MTARTLWRHAWGEARNLAAVDEEPRITSRLEWLATILLWARAAPCRGLCPADMRPWRLP